MTLQFVTVADSISKLSVSGMKSIRDLDAIPTKLYHRDCPILYPRPDGFISDLEIERVSAGDGSVAQLEVSYSLMYTYCHAKIGAGRSLFGVYPGFVSQLAVLLSTIITNDSVTGAVDIQTIDIGSFGPVADPIGTEFHGCDLVFEVTEFVN